MRARIQVDVDRDTRMTVDHHHYDADELFGGTDRDIITLEFGLAGAQTLTLAVDDRVAVALMQLIVQGLEKKARNELARVGIVDPDDELARRRAAQA